MLKRIHIVNYTLIDNLCIDFTNGFHVITGETGAGKSVILDAISLLLGARADRFSTLERKEKCVIEGVFLLDKKHESFFLEHDLDFDNETIIRRELASNGKSRAFVNDTPILLSNLSDLSKLLVETHTQNESIGLKDSQYQIALIDHLCDSYNEFNQYQKAFFEYKELQKDYESLKLKVKLSDNELDFIHFQLDELQKAELVVGEKDKLEETLFQLENLEHISRLISENRQVLDGEYGIVSVFSKFIRDMNRIPMLKDISERLNSVNIELNDISQDLLSIASSLQSDPKSVADSQDRLDLLNSLLVKHKKTSISELIKIQEEFKILSSSNIDYEDQIINAEKDLEDHESKLKKYADKLSSKRRLAVNILIEKVPDILVQLGMSNALFDISIRRVPLSILGQDDICFLFTANKGSSLSEIKKVASGGELSRLVLAIKYVTAQSDSIPTLIFDEIDTGVSGEIASLMSDLMMKISENSQLIAVTHLPQIAAKSDIHIKVLKKQVNDRDLIDVKILSEKDRLEEIAKLLSGKKISDAAYRNAEQLLNH